MFIRELMTRKRDAGCMMECSVIMELETKLWHSCIQLARYWGLVVAGAASRSRHEFNRSLSISDNDPMG
ncbi:hypothetical protein CEW88_23735 (plasmid) [Alloyangia pacifica]|uniref:Uncharacterized protein n=1 Tax=Alloyangia pacifica TaxID=311180 RepID=A0A2U8HLL1_9RHOB|nr:hypothetical protein CEW88_23735 [Alloyangia pacifica]